MSGHTNDEVIRYYIRVKLESACYTSSVCHTGKVYYRLNAWKHLKWES